MTTAPNNEAFLALGQETLDSLKLPENSDTLAGILLGHVVDGAVMSSDLSNGQMVQTLNEEMPIEVEFGTDGSIVLMGVSNDANVVPLFDVPACNGVIHTINAVLLPPSDEPGCPENPGSIVDVALGAAPEFSILVDLVTRADLGGYLADLSKESTVFGE